MKNHIKVAAFGGTGKSGKYVTRLLQQEKIPSRLLMRNVKKGIPPEFCPDPSSLEIIEGNALSFEEVLSTLKGCQAVISTLGLGIPPSEPTLFCQATQNILQAMEALGISRYILTTGLNVDTPDDDKGPDTTWATHWMYQTYPVSTQNRQDEYELLVSSKVDWTLVRLPMIEETDNRGAVEVSLSDCPGKKISASDLADFLVKQLSDKAYLQKAPFIANT